MRRSDSSVGASGILFALGAVLILSTMLRAQESGLIRFDIVSGDEFHEVEKLNSGDLADLIAENVWIVGGVEVPGLKGRLQLGVLSSSAMNDEKEMSEWVIKSSEPFELDAKVDAKGFGEKALLGYAGYYSVRIGEVLSRKQLVGMVDEVAYGEERPLPFDIPCCDPLSPRVLMKALDEAGLVGEKRVLNEKGVLKEGHVLLVLAPLPLDSDEQKAPGFGDRRKSVGGVVFVLAKD